MLPFLLIILHFSQIGFTDDLTFTVISPFLRSLLPSIIPAYTPDTEILSENSITGCQYLYIDTLSGIIQAFQQSSLEHYTTVTIKNQVFFQLIFCIFSCTFLAFFTRKHSLSLVPQCYCFTEKRETQMPPLHVRPRCIGSAPSTEFRSSSVKSRSDFTYLSR